MKCGHCTRTDEVDVVCHHCGTPFCPEHRHPRTDDPVFVSQPTLIARIVAPFRRRQTPETPVEPVVAYHCSKCVHTPEPAASKTES